MKLSERRSIATMATSPVSRAPRPSAPARQCRTVAPAKCPPVRTSRMSSESRWLRRPWHDRRMRPGDPLAIVAMQIDRHAAERLAPVGDGAIEMRMRDRDRLQPAERFDVFDRFARSQRNAIPEHAAIGLTNQQRTLSDRKARLDGRCRECRDRRARPACDLSPIHRGSAIADPSSSQTAARPRRSGRLPGDCRSRETGRRIVRRSIAASASLLSDGVVAQNARISQWRSTHHDVPAFQPRSPPRRAGFDFWPEDLLIAAASS